MPQSSQFPRIRIRNPTGSVRDTVIEDATTGQELQVKGAYVTRVQIDMDLKQGATRATLTVEFPEIDTTIDAENLEFAVAARIG